LAEPSSSARATQQPPRVLWDQARAVSGDLVEQNREFGRLMIANGHWQTAIWQDALGHRIFATHGPGEMCADCPCWHCGATKDDPDGDHTCPCPYGDNECPWHTNPVKAASDA
jgi:hypothetical protein